MYRLIYLIKNKYLNKDSYLAFNVHYIYSYSGVYLTAYYSCSGTGPFGSLLSLHSILPARPAPCPHDGGIGGYQHLCGSQLGGSRD